MTLHDVSLADRFDLAKQHGAARRHPGAGPGAADAEGARRGGGPRHRRLRHRLPRLAARRRRPGDVKARQRARGRRRQVRARPQRGSRRHRALGQPAGRACTARAASQGVFGLWYGKGPGVDRCGDVFRHANMAGTAEFGGVVACLGDDHTGESSTVAAPLRVRAGRRDDADPLARRRAGGARLRPARLGALALHRLLGRAEMRQGHHRGHRGRRRRPAPAEDRHPDRLRHARGRAQHPPATTRRSRRKRGCTTTSASPPRPSPAPTGSTAASGATRGAKIGIVSCGKSWLDTQHALDLLGLDDAECRRLGITTYKVGMVWPLDMASFREWAHDLELIIVVEEKRKLVEVQIKEAIFDDRRGRRVIGWKNEPGETDLLGQAGARPGQDRPHPRHAARPRGHRDRGARRRAAPCLDEAVRADNAEEIAVRKPWFCSGCPHNTSTRLPEGARAYAGIGCHYMVQWMDRDTEGFTHMGGEGANWIGEAPFSTRTHIFQNLGDGTYNHSGVAGDPRRARRRRQHHLQDPLQRRRRDDRRPAQRGRPDRPADRPRAAWRWASRRVVGVYDPKEDIDLAAFPAGMRHAPARRARRRAARDAGGRRASRRSSTSRPAPPRSAAAASAAPSPTPTAASSSTPTSARAAATAACSRTASRSCRSRPSSAASASSTSRPATRTSPASNGFCPSFVTLEGAKVRKAAARRARAARPAGAEAAGDRRHLQHRHHRRRRHRRRHRRRADRHGRAPRGQGRRRDGDGGPRPEGRRGPHPLPHRRDARPTSRRSASRSARPTR